MNYDRIYIVFGVTSFDWNDMEASLKIWGEEPKTEPHFMGILNIFFDGTVEDYYILGDFVDNYLSCSYIENTRIINVFCKDAKAHPINEILMYK